MKLSEVFDALTWGELAQLNIGGAENRAINEDNHKSVVSSINLGLIDLHTRFNLKEGQEDITLVPTQTVYVLGNMDILKVTGVLTEMGWPLGLNDPANPLACSTPSMISMRVPGAIVNRAADLPDELKTTRLTAVYRAKPAPVLIPEWGTTKPDTIDVELPYSHQLALLYFVASRIHTPQGADGRGFHVGNDFMAKYESECRRLDYENLRVDKVSQEDRLHRAGWV